MKNVSVLNYPEIHVAKCFFVSIKTTFRDRRFIVEYLAEVELF